MKQITIKVEESNFKAFINFINTLDYVKVLETKMNQSEINTNEKKSLAGALSKESVDLLVKHGDEIRNEWERDF